MIQAGLGVPHSRFNIQDSRKPQTPFINYQDTAESEWSTLSNKNQYGGWKKLGWRMVISENIVSWNPQDGALCSNIQK